MAIEGIYLLLTGKVLAWESIQKKMVGHEFVEGVLNMNLKKIKAPILAKFKKEYIGNKEWDI